MNVILLTVLVLGGNGGSQVSLGSEQGGYSQCEECVDGHAGHFANHKAKKYAKPPCFWFMGPMPQTCYEPPYGCYNGSRWNHRLTAFHGNYYRKPYNYRNVFDYPWHAELHEPTSQFSYQVTGDTGEEILPQTPAGPGNVPPPPLPTPASLELPLHAEMDAALEAKSIQAVAPNKLRSLRR